jgi:hypothetical protein
MRKEAAMPIWVVKATWIEDEAEASEQWEVNADMAHDAVKEVTMRLHFRPHHVEARLCVPETENKALAIDLPPGQARRIPPE